MTVPRKPPPKRSAAKKPAVRKRPAPKPKLGAHRLAFDQAVEALATGPEHAALVELGRTLATTLDAAAKFDKDLYAEYRRSLVELWKTAGGPRGEDGSFAEYVEALRRAEVGDSPKS